MMTKSKHIGENQSTIHTQHPSIPSCEVDQNMRLTTVNELLPTFASHKMHYAPCYAAEDANSDYGVNHGKRPFMPDLNDQYADNFILIDTPEVSNVRESQPVTREFLSQLELDKIPVIHANPHEEDTEVINRVKLFLAKKAKPMTPIPDKHSPQLDNDAIQQGRLSIPTAPRTIVTKYASTFFLDINPAQELKLIFPGFSSKYNIPNVVSLTDPRSNASTIGVVRRGPCVYLNQGWNQFVRFYNVYGGTWVRMIYINDGQFRVNVYKDNSNEIIYPKLKRPITSGHLDPPLIPPPPIDSAIFYEPPYFVGTYKKTINYQEAVGHRLNISLNFAVKALPFYDGNMEIIDPNGTHWPCSFVHKTDDPEYGAILQGWFELNIQWQLRPGTNVTFAVKKYHTRSLHMLLE